MSVLNRYWLYRDFIAAALIMLMVCSCTVRRSVMTGTVKDNSDHLHQEQAPGENNTADPFGKKLSKEDLQEQKLRAAFREVLESRLDDLPFPEQVSRIYEKGNYQLLMVPRFLRDHQLQNLLDYLNNSDHHGLDARLFLAADFKKELDEVSAYKSSDTLKIHRRLAKLELAFLSSLLRYSIALQYGMTNPAKIYSHYAIPTSVPDSNFVTRVFEIHQLKNYLDSIQPKDKTYRALQQALIRSGTAEQENRQALIVNMERLRWKNKPAAQKFVWVNIADFSLDVMDRGKSVLHMNVCVGEPGEKQTPQLGSLIRLVQINPVWNIPHSIARNEISRYAAADRNYLSDNHIKTFRKGKLIRNTGSIDWTTADLNDYSFQQQPGPKNSLGRIKFLFDNESSVYLHDTPVRTAFKRKMRAISHGCVRVEKPLDLAAVLFGKDEKYKLIKNGMRSGYPRAKFIGLPQQIPIRLFYYTAWLDDKGVIRFAKDIYGLDQMVYEAMQNWDMGKKVKTGW
jgi:murein L,D-transpeptidase YcbB/YkuD